MVKKSERQKATDADEKVAEEKELREVDPLDHNFPLLKEFREEAPGSFKHTQALVSMIDNVGASIDLDSGYLKLAAMYHDIGKMWAPECFSENQPAGENIYDELDPQISYYILTRHVSDSVAILVGHDFPEEAIKMVSQHHGTTVLKAIYEQAKRLYPKDKILAEQFRYRTQKPSSLESLILLLCDHVEATSRATFADQDQKLDATSFITDIFNKLMADGQFDNVEIRLGHLNKIQEALISDVAGSFHKRVKYEGDDVKLEREE